MLLSRRSPVPSAMIALLPRVIRPPARLLRERVEVMLREALACPDAIVARALTSAAIELWAELSEDEDGQ